MHMGGCCMYVVTLQIELCQSLGRGLQNYDGISYNNWKLSRCLKSISLDYILDPLLGWVISTMNNSCFDYQLILLFFSYCYGQTFICLQIFVEAILFGKLGKFLYNEVLHLILPLIADQWLWMNVHGNGAKIFELSLALLHYTRFIDIGVFFHLPFFRLSTPTSMYGRLDLMRSL
jgi:hypothetical protein